MGAIKVFLKEVLLPSGKRVQHIHIQYDGLGFIPLNELMKEETA